MLQVANTLIERTHAFESRTFRNAYSRRLRAFLNVISASARYKYYSVMHTENAHHDKDHSLSMPRKKSSNDDEDDPFVFDLEFDFETSVIWRVWAFAVSEGLKDAIATAGKLKRKKKVKAKPVDEAFVNVFSELSSALQGSLSSTCS